MPQYEYRAIARDSQPVSGILVADTEVVLERRIADLGLFLIEARVSDSNPRARGRVKVTRRTLMDFFNGLSTLLDAGIDVSQSLNVLMQETKDEGFQQVIKDLRINIESGVSLSQAMVNYPHVFDAQISNLIAAGEHSGHLVETCQDVSNHLDWLDRLMGDVRQATMYPAMIVVAVIGLIGLMFTFVVPRFSMIFDSLDLELPLLTVAVIRLGELASQYWWAGLLLFVSLVAGVRVGPKYYPAIGLWLDKVLLELPLVGAVNRMLVLSRFSHNLGMMLRAGISIDDALGFVRAVAGNRVMALALADAQQSVTRGERMSDALSRHSIISPMVMRILVVGEETGRLDSCLETVSKRLDQDIPRRLKALFGVLEPMLIITLLGIVGLVGGAIFMPLLSLMSGISG